MIWLWIGGAIVLVLLSPWIVFAWAKCGTYGALIAWEQFHNNEGEKEDGKA